MIDRQLLKEKLPHGYMSKIAKRAEVSEQMVRQYFKGNKNSERVEIAALEVLAELNQRKKQLLEQIL